MKLSHDPTIIRELPQLAVATLNFTDVDSAADTMGRAAPFNDCARMRLLVTRRGVKIRRRWVFR